MRNAFADEITSLASMDERIVILSGDIGNRLFNDYKSKYSDRFFNCGVAEANMTGVAAGMALSGLRPFTYTITSFATTRCMEQIRLDVAYQNAPVVIVGTGSGLSYASLGATHHSLEDIAFLRAIPNMTVICPADTTELRLALRAMLSYDAPIYLRIGKKNEPLVHQTNPEFSIGKGIVLRKGSDVCLLSTGNVLSVAMQMAEQLADDGVSAQVVSMHTVKPLDDELLSEVFEQFPLVVALEEHSVVGGFSSAVAEWMVDHTSQKSLLCRFGTADQFLQVVGTQQYARDLMGLKVEDMMARINQKIGLLRQEQNDS